MSGQHSSEDEQKSGVGCGCAKGKHSALLCKLSTITCNFNNGN